MACALPLAPDRTALQTAICGALLHQAAELIRQRAALERIAKYPPSGAEELSAAGLRDIARAALEPRGRPIEERANVHG